MFIGKLDNIVDKCNNTYRTIKIKPTDVKVSKYIDLDVEDKDPKFKVCDHARRSFCCRKKVRNIVPWTHEKEDLNSEDIFGTFYEKHRPEHIA